MRRRSKNQLAQRKAAAVRPGASRDQWWLLGICVFLIAITWIVFGQILVMLAERADSFTHGESPVITLVADYAEAGRFADALTTGERALQLANAEGNAARTDSIPGQIKLYQSGAALRDHRYASNPR